MSMLTAEIGRQRSLSTPATRESLLTLVERATGYLRLTDEFAGRGARWDLVAQCETQREQMGSHFCLRA